LKQFAETIGGQKNKPGDKKNCCLEQISTPSPFDRGRVGVGVLALRFSPFFFFWPPAFENTESLVRSRLLEVGSRRPDG